MKIKLVNLFSNKDTTTSKWANVIKVIAIITMVVTSLAFAAIGGVIGYQVVDYSDNAIGIGVGITVGLLVGGIVGLIGMSLIMFLSELGKNMRIAAESTKKANIVSETDQIMIYKELLDSGAITQEEFYKKKKELLNL